MSRTLSGPVFPFVPWLRTPLVYVRKEFGDGWSYREQAAQFGRRFGEDWTLAPELEFTGATLNSSAQDLDRCTLQRRYGDVREPWATAVDAQRLPLDLRGWWVCIMFGEFIKETRRRGTTSPHWLGRIDVSPRDIYHPDAGRSGVQDWTAYGPAQLLRLTSVSASYWLQNAQTVRLDWLQSMNLADQNTMQVGNRTAEKYGGTYLHGGRQLWTHYDYLEYLFARFMDQKWYLGGQAALLKNIVSYIDWPETITLDAMLARLIPLEYGFDYTVRWRNAGAEPGQTWNAGWEINVYSVLPKPVTFGATTLPENPNRIELDLRNRRDLQVCRQVPADEFIRDRVAVLGKRVVTVTTLDPRGPTPTLEKKHTPTQEQAYKDGTGTAGDPAVLHDAARKNPQWRNVWRRFGAPEAYDPGASAPVIGYDGQPTLELAAYQNTVRRTLPWLPLLQDYDYTQDPPVDLNATNKFKDFLPPIVLIEEFSQGYSVGLFSVEDLGIGVDVLPNEWGIFLSHSPNHVVAGADWTGYNPSNTLPRTDWKTLFVTIAHETDQRAGLYYEKPGATGNWLILSVPDAELWFLTPGTVVGVEPSASTPQYSPAGGVVLRNDTDKLERAMCGAIYRYTQERVRVRVELAGLLPYQDLIGRILTIEDGTGELQDFAGLVTTVEWVVSSNRAYTIVSAGYAI